MGQGQKGQSSPGLGVPIPWGGNGTGTGGPQGSVSPSLWVLVSSSHGVGWAQGLPGACSPRPFGVSVSPSLWGFCVPIPLVFWSLHPQGAQGDMGTGTPHILGSDVPGGDMGWAMPPTGAGCGAVGSVLSPTAIIPMSPRRHWGVPRSTPQWLCSGAVYGAAIPAGCVIPVWRCRMGPSGSLHPGAVMGQKEAEKG